MHETIARWRLRSQRLDQPHAPDSARVLDSLLAVQAENPTQSSWAVATRTARPSPADLAGRLATGEVVRTHVLRTTWHYVRRDDIDWLLALTGPTLQRLTARQLQRDAGVSAADLERVAAAVTEALHEVAYPARDKLVALVGQALPDLASRMTNVSWMMAMLHLELGRLVVSGPPRADGAHTYAAYDDRVPRRVDLDRFDRDDGLARLALRYFTGHGPATVKDLAYWGTLTMRDARRGLDAVREQLASFDHDSRTFWHAIGEPPEGPSRPRGHLLQILDETYRGYQDSRWTLDARGVVPRGRETASGIALVDGQLVASMKRSVDASRAVFELVPFTELTRDQRAALDDAARRYGDFLGVRGELAVAPAVG